jgi:hypothetical protein
MKNSILGLFILLLLGCEATSAPDPGDELVIKYGQTIVDRNISIKFQGLGEDSRCPLDVECVWAGNAEIFLQIASADSTTIYSLNTFLEPNIVSHDGYLVELVQVSPYPVAGETIALESYEIRVALIK